MQISPSRHRSAQQRPRRLLHRSMLLAAVGLAVASCGATTATTQTDRVVPEPTEVPTATAVPTPVPQPEPTATPVATASSEASEQGDDDTAGADAEAAAAEAERPVIRSFQEFLPDPAAIEERYGDGGLWTLTDIKYLEPGPRLGLPCGDTEPPDFDGIEAIYTNVSGENLLVMVQQGDGVDVWVQGVAEGVECTELGIRQSALTVPDTDQSIVLEIDPAAPAASMAISGALQDDIFISFVAGAVSPDSAVADPNPLVDLTVAMFDRINAAE